MRVMKTANKSEEFFDMGVITVLVIMNLKWMVKVMMTTTCHKTGMMIQHIIESNSSRCSV